MNILFIKSKYDVAIRGSATQNYDFTSDNTKMGKRQSGYIRKYAMNRYYT